MYRGALALLAVIDVLYSPVFRNITTLQLSHSPVNGPLVIFMFFSITNNAAMNIFVCVTLETQIWLWKYCTDLQVDQQCRRGSIFLYPSLKLNIIDSLNFFLPIW